jgi:hypothetical protein
MAHDVRSEEYATELNCSTKEGNRMRMEVLASFLFATEAVNYIEKHELNAIVSKNIFTGKYDVLDAS